MNPEVSVQLKPLWQIILLGMWPILFMLVLVYVIYRKFNKLTIHKSVYIALLLIFLVLIALYIFGVFECVSSRASGGMEINWYEIKDCSY